MNGQPVHAATIGTLTDEQLAAIIMIRAEQEPVPIVAEVLFVGGHIYKRRVVADGYTIDDVLDQVSSAMHPSSIVIDSPYMTAMENPDRRADRYGNSVKDRAVFECSTRHPRPELFSVTPKGDRIKPGK
jgi:hypothetical protein